MKVIQMDEILSIYNALNVNPNPKTIRTSINTGFLSKSINTGIVGKSINIGMSNIVEQTKPKNISGLCH